MYMLEESIGYKSHFHFGILSLHFTAEHIDFLFPKLVLHEIADKPKF